MNLEGKAKLVTVALLIVLVVCVLILVPKWFKERRIVAVRNACLANLSYLEGAKEQAASDLKVGKGGVLTEEQVSKYIKDGFGSLKCGAGGNYSLNSLGTNAACNVPGHQLP